LKSYHYRPQGRRTIGGPKKRWGEPHLCKGGDGKYFPSARGHVSYLIHTCEIHAKYLLVKLKTVIQKLFFSLAFIPQFIATNIDISTKTNLKDYLVIGQFLKRWYKNVTLQSGFMFSEKNKG